MKFIRSLYRRWQAERSFRALDRMARANANDPAKLARMRAMRAEYVASRRA